MPYQSTFAMGLPHVQPGTYSQQAVAAQGVTFTQNGFRFASSFSSRLWQQCWQQYWWPRSSGTCAQRDLQDCGRAVALDSRTMRRMKDSSSLLSASKVLLPIHYQCQWQQSEGVDGSLLLERRAATEQYRTVTVEAALIKEALWCQQARRDSASVITRLVAIGLPEDLRLWLCWGGRAQCDSTKAA